jgi:phage-related minor tail protein
MADLTVRHEIVLADDTKAFLTALVRPFVAGVHHLEHRMSAVDDALAAIGTSVDELVKDVQRLIDLFTAAGELTPEQQAAVDALQAKLAAVDTAVEGAAPEQP